MLDSNKFGEYEIDFPKDSFQPLQLLYSKLFDMNELRQDSTGPYNVGDVRGMSICEIYFFHMKKKKRET